MRSLPMCKPPPVRPRAGWGSSSSAWPRVGSSLLSDEMEVERERAGAAAGSDLPAIATSRTEPSGWEVRGAAVDGAAVLDEAVASVDAGIVCLGDSWEVLVFLPLRESLFFSQDVTPLPSFSFLGGEVVFWGDSGEMSGAMRSARGSFSPVALGSCLVVSLTLGLVSSDAVVYLESRDSSPDASLLAVVLGLTSSASAVGAVSLIASAGTWSSSDVVVRGAENTRATISSAVLLSTFSGMMVSVASGMTASELIGSLSSVVTGTTSSVEVAPRSIGLTGVLVSSASGTTSSVAIGAI